MVTKVLHLQSDNECEKISVQWKRTTGSTADMENAVKYAHYNPIHRYILAIQGFTCTNLVTSVQIS